MTRVRHLNWTLFWALWIGGLAIFVAIVATNSGLVTDAAPGGIVSHQAAGNAANINLIQRSWEDAGKTDYAFWSMVADLIFIGLYAIGGIIGGLLMWRHAHSPTLKKLGLVIIVAYFVFGATDYIETFSQIWQLARGSGSDLLAAIAASMNPTKSIAFIIGTLAMIGALIWRAVEKRKV